MPNQLKRILTPLLIITILIIGVAFTVGVDAGQKEQPVIDKHSAELWNKYIKDKPERILNNWGLAWCILYHQAGDQLNNQLASFATVAFSRKYQTRIGTLVLKQKDLIIYAQNLKGTALSDAEKKSIRDLYARIKQKYGDRSTPFNLGTFGMGKAFYLGLTVNDKSWLDKIKAKCGIGDGDDDEPKDWVERALYRIAKYHGWKAVLEKTQNATFLDYKKAIDGDIPVLLYRDKYYRILVGYLMTGKCNYLLTVDLKEIPVILEPSSPTPKARARFEALPPDNPWRKTYEYEKTHLKFPTDLFVQSSIPLHPGFLFEPFEKGKYRAYFIHDWQKSIDAWKSEIKKILKLDEKGKK